jgi:hypothetical protein
MRCRCGFCPTGPVGRVTRGNVVAAIGVGLSAVLEVDRIRRYPIRTETTRLEENSRVVFSFVVVHLTTRSEKVSIPRLWRTVANATLAPSTQTGRGGWGWGWGRGSSNLLAGLGTRGAPSANPAPWLQPKT